MRCGVGDYTASLARALQDSAKAQIAVLTGAGEISTIPGVEIIQVSNWGLKSAVHVLNAIARSNPDVVHMQFPTQGYADDWLPWMLPLVMRIIGLHVVQTWHEFLPMGGHRRSFLLCIACDTAIVVRPNFMQSISSWYRLMLGRKRVVYIPNATSIPRSRLSLEERKQLYVAFRNGQDRVVTYFGFANPNKGVELIFQIADPHRDRIVLICDLTETNPYHREILSLCESPNWRGKVTVTGFIPSDNVADILAVSDAVVLPFPEGGGSWNSSISAALEQGTLVITTSDSEDDYDPVSNIFYCKPGDVESMARALVTYGGRKTKGLNSEGVGWARIADEHLQVYGEILTRSRVKST